MSFRKETKPFPTLQPTKPNFSQGRTVLFINADGLKPADEKMGLTGQLVLFTSDADQEVEIYAPISAAN